MPAITVQLLKACSLDSKKKFAEDVTKSACECFNVPPEHVWITFDESAPENFVAMAGKLYIDKNPINDNQPAIVSISCQPLTSETERRFFD